jgi:hypothetical protein
MVDYRSHHRRNYAIDIRTFRYSNFHTTQTHIQSTRFVGLGKGGKALFLPTDKSHETMNFGFVMAEKCEKMATKNDQRQTNQYHMTTQPQPPIEPYQENLQAHTIGR